MGMNHVGLEIFSLAFDAMSADRAGDATHRVLNGADALMKRADDGGFPCHIAMFNGASLDHGRILGELEQRYRCYTSSVR